MRTEYEKLLDRMYFEIGSTLIDNDCCRKGIEMSKIISEDEILRSNRRTYMNLKVMMMRLEHSLFGVQKVEKTEQKISDRHVGETDNTVTVSRTP